MVEVRENVLGRGGGGGGEGMQKVKVQVRENEWRRGGEGKYAKDQGWS